MNWWGRAPDPASADHSFPGGMNKAEGFLELAAQDQIPWREYGYILLLDDDVQFPPGDVSRLFEICAAHGTYLAQPALRWGSYASHPVTLRNPMCRLRATSFVEMMAPVFSRAALENLLDTFSLTRSTWGIDWAWSSKLSGKRPIHVVDSIAVDHTKPVNLEGGVFYSRLRAMGADPKAELKEIQRRFPDFGGIRTLPGGHALRAGIPHWAGAMLVAGMDRCIRLAHFHGWSEAVASRRPWWSPRPQSGGR